MKNWKYTIETAKKLREIINNSDSSYEDCQKTLNEIIIVCSCIREILNPKDREIWVDSFDDMIRDVQDAIDYEISEDNDTEENEDIVNHYLSELYDLCDTANIFLAV